MTVDPVTRVAIAMDARPGAFALLLGSGISTAAGIPTGWDVVKELARQVMAASGDSVDDPVAWFTARHGVEPTYSALVAELGLTEAVRQSVVVGALTHGTGRFPRPTPAHKAVAALVVGGWVKVVITTNFDPLLETAVESVGGAITVLSTDDHIKGALPIAHAGPTLIKLHGDYRDTRIRNTESELLSYPKATEARLDQVFDEYGLIVCGWSANHDVGLRKAIERCASRRFGTFWAARSGQLTGAAHGLAQRREAEVLPNVDADQFLGGLADAVRSLRSTKSTPVSTTVEVASVKRELQGGRVAIAAHDRLQRAFADLHRTVVALPTDSQARHGETLDGMVGELDAMAALLATVAYWGDESTDRWWLGEIGRFSTRRGVNGTSSMLQLAQVPGLLALWTSGIAAVASRRDDLVTDLLKLPPTNDPMTSRPASPLELLLPRVLHLDLPVAWLYRRLRAAFVDQLGLSREAFVEAFELWQFTLEVHAAFGGPGTDFEAIIHVDGYKALAPPALLSFLGELRRLQDKHPVVRAIGTGLGEVEKQAKEVATSIGERTARIDRDSLPVGGGSIPSGLHYPGRHHADADMYFGA